MPPHRWLAVTSAMILVVVLVPEHVGDWLNATEQELALRRCGYWVSLRGLPTTTNENAVAVHVPRSQVFHPTTLRAIMQRLAQGALP